MHDRAVQALHRKRQRARRGVGGLVVAIAFVLLSAFPGPSLPRPTPFELGSLVLLRDALPSSLRRLVRFGDGLHGEPVAEERAVRPVRVDERDVVLVGLEIVVIDRRRLGELALFVPALAILASVLLAHPDRGARDA